MNYQLVWLICKCGLFVILFSNCHSETNTILSENKVIPPPVEVEPYILGGYFAEIEPIALETKAESQIGRITKFVVAKGRIFVLDYDQKTLFMFDLNGKYLNKINKVGKGPGEFHVLGDFWINENENIIDILVRRKIIRYNFEGTFINEISIDISGLYLAKTSKDNYYIYTGSQFDGKKNPTLNYINNTGKQIQSYFHWNTIGRLFRVCQ